jgi:hypothetical protein
MVSKMKDIKSALSTEDPDFALVLGVGSLVVNSGVTDYTNQSNVIHSSNLGRATPQLLTGVSFSSRVPTMITRFRRASLCAPGQAEKSFCAERWQKYPWSGFVSLKFAPGSSQLLNGYVIGGSFAITHYLNALIGFALTPINEPAPGFRITASQFVTNQQNQGLDQNFNAGGLLANAPNAYDGFPVTDPTGKLIYQGDPLTVHYRGGVIFGVSFPIYFKSIW